MYNFRVLIDNYIFCDILLAKKEALINTIDFLEIENIKEDVLITKDKYIRILKIHPINYDLKSDFEKQSIISAYKTVLKTCDFDFQILILSEKENINENIRLLNTKLDLKTDFLNKEKLVFETKEEIEGLETKEQRIKHIYKNYIKFIKKINYDENITSKTFYIVFCEQRLNIKPKNLPLFNFKNIKKMKEKHENDSQKKTKDGLHNNLENFDEITFYKVKKALDDKEKKLSLSIIKCGNFIEKVNEKEIYNLFSFSSERR